MHAVLGWEGKGKERTALKVLYVCVLCIYQVVCGGCVACVVYSRARLFITGSRGCVMMVPVAEFSHTVSSIKFRIS